MLVLTNQSSTRDCKQSNNPKYM